jgi:hypothetical protein
MDPKFGSLTEHLATKFERLMAMAPVVAAEVPKSTPLGGVYLFSEHGIPLYAGRTKRRIGVRIRGHFSTAEDCPLAWSLAREATGYKATYKKQGSRTELLSRPDFARAYQAAKDRISQMEVRWVEEADPLRQTLLEVYLAVVAGAKYNDFSTH